MRVQGFGLQGKEDGGELNTTTRIMWEGGEGEKEKMNISLGVLFWSE